MILRRKANSQSYKVLIVNHMWMDRVTERERDREKTEWKLITLIEKPIQQAFKGPKDLSLYLGFFPFHLTQAVKINSTQLKKEKRKKGKKRGTSSTHTVHKHKARACPRTKKRVHTQPLKVVNWSHLFFSLFTAHPLGSKI